MHNIIVSDVMIENLAEKLGVDFKVPRVGRSYMHEDNEKTLFVEAAISLTGAVTFNGDATHYVVDDETFVTTIFGLCQSWIAAQTTKQEDVQ